MVLINEFSRSWPQASECRCTSLLVGPKKHKSVVKQTQDIILCFKELNALMNVVIC